MPTYTKHPLSESVGGMPIMIDATTSPGTLIHDVAIGLGVLDEVWIYATNTSGNDRLLTLQWGDVLAGNEIKAVITARSGLYVLVPGFLIDNDAEALSGTVSVTAGTKTVTGVGTSFISEIADGEYVQIGNIAQLVFSVSNDNELILEENFTGETVSGVEAARIRTRPIRGYAEVTNAFNVIGFVNRITP